MVSNDYFFSSPAPFKDPGALLGNREARNHWQLLDTFGHSKAPRRQAKLDHLIGHEKRAFCRTRSAHEHPRPLLHAAAKYRGIGGQNHNNFPLRKVAWLVRGKRMDWGQAPSDNIENLVKSIDCPF